MANAAGGVEHNKRALEAQICEVEKQLYELEGTLLADRYNIIAGFGGFEKAPTAVSEASKAAAVIAPEQRIFSLSSLTSPAAGKASVAAAAAAGK